MTKSQEIITEEIKIWGIVQGVGFRPFIAKLARRKKINGYVKNKGGFVQIKVNGTKGQLDSFVNSIYDDKPEASDIVRLERKSLSQINFDQFTIEKSKIEEDEIGMIPADMSLCDNCLKEYNDSNDPRFKHPFISCSVCGPRYTIIGSLPYDRENTTMEDFSMCRFCYDQYTDETDIRYHAQTISCHDCGPMPEYYTQNGEAVKVVTGSNNRTSAADKAIEDINNGKVIALKGTGGYYFTCTPFKADTVKTLRCIKVREEKPFAVMFKDIESIREYCNVDKNQEELLRSNKRPIVLLQRKEKTQGPKIVNEVYRSSMYIGAFLPSFGLQYELIDQTGPLIMTSANLSDFPIIYKDNDMLEVLKQQHSLAGVLLNRRRIQMGLDDSVARVVDGSPQLTRRSKGYAPVPIYVETPEDLDKSNQIFATGGQLKSSFSLSKGNFAYVSQYFGDLDTLESQNIYNDNFYRMKDFFSISPKLIVSDMHPLYSTTKFAEDYVDKEQERSQNVKLIKVQHHHAHTASVMAEHGLSGPVIGVSFDGTGYGTDGNIWGGEFLICEKDDFKRYSHLKYVEMIGGDSSMKEGWKSAISYKLANSNAKIGKDERMLDINEIIDYSISQNTLSEYDFEQTIESAISNNINTIKTSSMGRLFDSVSSLLGIQHTNRYEGECAIMLENAAFYSQENPGINKAWDLALKFHYDVAEFIKKECIAIRQNVDINDIALSGGVFQNKILMERTLKILRNEGFEVYYNRAVPTNDGGIALGQNYIGMYHMAGNKK